MQLVCDTICKVSCLPALLAYQRSMYPDKTTNVYKTDCHKFLEWPCMWWVEADHCYVHVRLVKPCCSKIGSKHSYISHAHYIKGWKNEFALHIYEKSDLPSWSLLVCDEVCTLLQDLVEPLKSVFKLLLILGQNLSPVDIPFATTTAWCCKAVL